MSLLSKIKQGVASSGSNKGKIVYFKADSKVRFRFLSEVEDGVEVTVHDSFDRGINSICREHYGESCPYCEDDTMRTRTNYVWSVWDADAKEVKLFMGLANNFSPLPALIAMYETYGTLMDRDYVVQRDGKGTNTRYSVIPMDKVKFKNKDAKPLTKKKVMDILDKAFPVNESDRITEDDKSEKVKKKSKSRETEDDEDDEEDSEEENKYSGMNPKELYMECIERGLKAKKKQKKDYYVDMLLEDDLSKDEDEWEDEDEEDVEDEW